MVEVYFPRAPFKPLMYEICVPSWIQTLLQGSPTSLLTAVWSDVLSATAFPVVRRMRFDEIGIRISTTPPDTHFRLGLYGSDGCAYPKDLLAASGEITIVAGLNRRPINVTLEPGLYFICWLTDSDAAEFRYNSIALQPITVEDPSWALWQQYIGYGVTFPYGALPDPFPSFNPAWDYRDTWFYSVGLHVAEVLG